jgi:hypothetical protein
MGLLEWLGESYDPGAVGDVTVGKRRRPPRSRAAVIARGLLALVAVGWVTWFLLASKHASPLPALAVLAVYLVAGYFLHPEPDASNVGWFGGLFDHPFRWSDDFNRFLVFGLVILWPGRFVAESLVELVGLLVHARTPAS